MSRKLTLQETAWVNKMKRCIHMIPKSINLYISNENSEFQIYDTETKEVLDDYISHGFQQGDPLNKQEPLPLQIQS